MKRLTLTLIVLTVTAVTCGRRIGPAQVSVEPLEETGESGINLLVVAEGEVLLKRQTWADYYQTAFGAVLHRGDLLQVSNNAKAVVLCDGFFRWRVPIGVPSGLTNGCPQSPEPVLVSGKSELGSTRGGNDMSIPYIISPRRTQLLNNRPLLRWNETTEASSYHVQIKNTDTDQTIWDETMDVSAVTYPGEPPLEPNVTYLLIVVADNGTSSPDEGVPDLSFSLLDEHNAQNKWAGAVKLTELNLSAEAEAFVMAKLYAGHNLIAEAIEMLEILAEGGSQKAAVYRTLGDLYRHIGLNLLAEDRYLTAIQLTDVADDVEGLATAQAGLGEVYVALGKVDEAIKWLTEAKAGYDALGDTERTSELENRLAELGQ